MSEFFIQDKRLSTVTRTIVKDEKNRSIFLLVGHRGTRGDVLSLYAMNGQLLAQVKQTSFAFGSSFDLYKAFEKVGTLRKILNINADFYYIPHLHWTVLGNIKKHKYAIYQVNKNIMTMNKATLLYGDYFSLTVSNDADAPLCICIAAVLDYWVYNRKKQPFNSLIGWST